MASEVLTTAIYTVRRMRLFCVRDVELKHPTEEGRHQAKVCIWFLYTMEIDESLRQGMPPLCSHGWFDWPGQNNSSDFLYVKCSAAALQLAIFNKLYGLSALSCRTKLKDATFTECRGLLDNWFLGFAPQNSERGNDMNVPSKRLRQLVMFHYHRLRLFIFCPWIDLQIDALSKGESMLRDPDQPLQECVYSAITVISSCDRESILDQNGRFKYGYLCDPSNNNDDDDDDDNNNNNNNLLHSKSKLLVSYMTDSLSYAVSFNKITLQPDAYLILSNHIVLSAFLQPEVISLILGVIDMKMQQHTPKQD
ncbi:hypothetical protein PFICI_00027 [Pestalotiopsis fici W106-1]|uniref:Transcription factor domain-containing protein n=1 Tax=Pestalotiopsis fici (strain W106-1 / CGMCC3.15140) TaxID=1229662 RepID=W3XJK5_PESFW|nr:uncharacterized protein PFICI_00027 [Pestalotiopsis fici W106-1]ETS86199.1 hypothetical protein PFICI_00027 [Pestalotiopsis fici W106-1]